MERTAKKTKSTVASLSDFAGKHRKTYAISVALAVLGVAFAILPYFAVSNIIIALLSGQQDISYYFLQLAFVVVGFAGKTTLHNISTTLSHTATFAVISEVRRRIAEKMTRVPMGHVLDTPSGNIKNTMVEKVDSIEPTLAHVLPEMTSNILVPICIIIYLFVLDWRMALVSLVTMPIGIVCYMGMMNGYEVKFRKMIQLNKYMNATAVEYVNGIEVIKTFGQTASSYGKYTEAVKEDSTYGLKWMKEVQIFMSLGFGIWPAVLVGVLPVGCLLYAGGSLAAGTFITIMLLSMGIMGPILAAVMFTDDIAQIGSIVGDINSILDWPEQERPDKRATLTGTEITLKDVSFAYHEKEVLHSVNLVIPAASVTALVGPSGSGKSTLAKLIASFWDADTGSISIGSMDVKNIPTSQLTDMIAYVAQDNYLFDDTVRNNIRMGRPAASDMEVEAAAKASGCHEFICKLQHGYDTVCGGAGGHLSGGERQRIAIARAMLKNAPIVILDEATAYTDPENEAVIQQAVAKLVAGKTLIVIAHRLSTITDADKIVVVENGRIAAEGTHDVLLQQSSLYSALWQAHISSRDAA